MKYLVIAVLTMISLQALAQRDSSEYTKPSPYELISSYYDDGFSPFKKRNGYLGLAFSLQDQSLINTQRLLDKVIDGGRFNYNIELSGGYFLGDYTQVGLTFSFAYDKFEGTTLREGDTIRVEDISKVFTAIPFIKPYFPVTKNERLSFYMQLGIGLGGGNGLTRETKKLDEINKTYSEQFVLNVGLTPGITFFAIENFAFEVGINVLGYELKRTETTINEVETAIETRHNVNLRLNLLSLNIGLAYYF